VFFAVDWRLLRSGCCEQPFSQIDVISHCYDDTRQRIAMCKAPSKRETPPKGRRAEEQATNRYGCASESTTRRPLALTIGR
jgi:hypothetical protein